MFRRKIILFSIFTLILFNANTATANANKLVEELMEKSGLNLVLEQTPEQFSQGFKSGLAEMGKIEEFTKVDKIMRKSFDTNKLKMSMKDYISKKLPISDIKATLKWLDSSLGKKITELENKSQTAEYQTYLMENIENILSKTDKLERAKRFDKAVKMTDKIVSMILNMQKTMMVAMMPYAPKGQQMVTSQIKKIVEESREQTHAMMEKMVQASIINTYQTLSDKDFNKYLKFNESPSGVKYNNITMQAFNHSLEKALKKFAGFLGAEDI